jgi:membrane fusion protein (multidrug efflux system)
VHGQSAVITTQALPGRSIVGTVQSINPVTDNQGTTVGVRILCDNPGYQLKEGMPITASIVTFQHPHVMTVPVSALVSDPNEPDKKMVYIYKDKKVTRVPVKPGLQKDSRQEILSGLTPGQEIVASGAYGVPDGTEVEAQSGSLHADTKVTSKSD